MPSYGEVPDKSNKSPEGGIWLKLAKDAFERSTTYFDNNFRKQFEDGLRMFQSKHPKDSKYSSPAYQARSRLFRPKTRSMIRRHEATANMAFFSSPDIVSVEPVITEDEAQVASSVIMKDLLQHHLKKSIPWYLTVIGGLQDALVTGLVASLQTWEYQTRKETQTQTGFHPMLGEVTFEQEVDVVVKDQPSCELIPIENIRFDPAAKWYDPVNTSPYLIIQMPMYISYILDRMEIPDRNGTVWNKISKSILLTATLEDDSVRQARIDGKEDDKKVSGEVNEFNVVMVHMNFITSGGQTFFYYTLKDTHILSEPVPLEEAFLHGKIPVVVGFAVLETHKPIPTSGVILGKDLQSEANAIANTRMDNVLYILNKRWLIRRGANVDAESLVRNAPGGATMVNNIETDVKPVDWQDVTSSAYAEQDRVNVDYDELLGNFAQSSVMTNRKLNETVGGMRLMAQGANAITEYTLRLFVETWMEPVLRQLMLLEQYYETDEKLLTMAAQRAQLWKRAGMNEVTDKLLRQELILTVNVGMGATDPDTRFQRLIQAFGAYSNLAAEGPPDLNLPELRKVLFGLAGWQDAKRFFTDVDVRWQQAQQMLQQASQMAEQAVKQKREQMLQRERGLDKREMDQDVRTLEIETEDRLNEGEDKVSKALLQLASQVASSSRQNESNT